MPPSPGILPTVTVAPTGSQTVIATERPGYVASPLPSPGRLAPDVVSGPLVFSQVRVYAEPASGSFVLRANVTNSGAEFLNGIDFTWHIVNAAGWVLDQGETTITSLAPGETTSVELVGAALHDDGWSAVEFEYIDVSQ